MITIDTPTYEKIFIVYNYKILDDITTFGRYEKLTNVSRPDKLMDYKYMTIKEGYTLVKR